MSHLLTYDNPYVSEHVEHGSMEEEVFYPDTEDFVMAFAFENFAGNKPLDDQSFVKFTATVWRKEPG